MNVHLYEEIQCVEDLIKDTISQKENAKKRNSLNTNDPYTSLMNKEEKVLNMLNDYRKSEDDKQSAHKYLLTSPIHVVVFRTFRVLSKIMNDVYDSSGSINDVVSILLRKENVVYVGIFLVTLSILMMFVSV